MSNVSASSASSVQNQACNAIGANLNPPQTAAAPASQNGQTLPSAKSALGDNSVNYSGDFKQGKMGDCFLLSAIQSLEQNGTDLGKLISPSPSDDAKTQSYTVQLPGAGSGNKSVTVTQDDLAQDQSQGGTSGDLQTRILETAANKWAKANGTSLNTGDPGQAMTLFTGDKASSAMNTDSASTLDNLKNLASNHTATALWLNTPQGVHAVTLDSVSADGNSITYTDPHDSSKPITVSASQLISELQETTSDLNRGSGGGSTTTMQQQSQMYNAS